MKTKYRNELKILSYITATEKYKMIFFVTILIALYGGFILGTTSDNFFDSILIPLRFDIFNILLFTLIFLNNLNVCSVLKKDFPFYVIRLKNKKEYIKLVIKLTSLMFLFHMLILFLMMLVPLLLTTFNNLGIHNYENYSVNNLIYVCFYIIRYLIIGLLIMIISSLIYLNTSKVIVLIFDSIFLFGFMNFGGYIVFQEDISLLVWKYFNPVMYNSFITEVYASILMILILEISVIILYKISIRNKRISVI